MALRHLDLNADLGEEVTDDDGLLAVVTSANVACGFHAGTKVTMRSVCARAVELGVAIGAQVSYDDRANFGRVARDIEADLLAEQVRHQVGVLTAIAVSEGGSVSYVKPHGALYHRVLTDPVQASAVLAGSGELSVLTMSDSRFGELAAAAGRAVLLEGFADRRYVDGRLVPRDEDDAVHVSVAAVAAQAVELAESVHSVCVHGDSPNAVAHARGVRAALEAAGFTLAAPW